VSRSDPAVSDEAISRALGVYAGMVHRVLSDPGRWLGLDDDPPPSAGFPARALDALRDRAFGELTPASPVWGEQPLQKRVDWWVRRIGISAGLAAAAPRFAGALADRIPLQAALGASASGIAVCATAREHGLINAGQWVPLIAEVVLGRNLGPRPVPVPPPDTAEQLLEAEEEGEGAEQPEEIGRARALGRGAQRAVKTLWQLARALLDLQNMLDERPRGNLIARGIAKIPVVGVAGGWLDERGGISKAASQTASLIRAAAAPGTATPEQRSDKPVHDV
jgi:hypothetical protein